jgi:hypothetical protein
MARYDGLVTPAEANMDLRVRAPVAVSSWYVRMFGSYPPK